MPMYSEPFGKRVRQILTERDLSPYDVQRMSEGAISHQTVRNMLQGAAPYSDYILAFARAVGTDPNELLELAGRELRLPSRVTQRATEPRTLATAAR
jgi:hypothetical protein